MSEYKNWLRNAMAGVTPVLHTSAVDAELAALNLRLVALLDRLDALSEMPTKAEETPLPDMVDQVIRGIVDGKVVARQVDHLYDVAGKSKTDRAVGSAIKSSRKQQ
jgi:translation elongation factor EF-Tu-like GTPase